MRKLILFLAAVSHVLFAEKALCHGTTFAIGPESFNSFRYEEMRVQEAAPLSIRTGRFLSVDPIPGEVRKPQSWNMYAYVQNNPLRYTDPSGLTLYANTADAQKDICTFVGQNCSQYVSFDKNGKVTVTATAADLRATRHLHCLTI